MFTIVETFDGKLREVSAVPKSWVKYQDPLAVLWPKSNKGIASLIKNCSPPNSDWLLYSCLILDDDIVLYQEARKKEQSRAVFTNTDSENEDFLRKSYYRLHPTEKFSNHVDLNEMFLEPYSKKGKLTLTFYFFVLVFVFIFFEQ
jgi:hypothetical protein